MTKQQFRARVVGSLVGMLVLGVIASSIKAQSRPRSRSAQTKQGAESAPLSPSDSTQGVTPVKAPAPGSPEHRRLVAVHALIRQGRFPVYKIGADSRPSMNVAEGPVPRDSGVTIMPQSEATGDMLKLQQEFASAIARANIRPSERLDHFAWLQNTEPFQKGLVHPIGWYGAVVGVEPQSSGAVLFKIRIQPRLYSTQMKTFQADHVLEMYEFVAGKVRLIDSDANVPKTQYQVFPAIQ